MTNPQTLIDITDLAWQDIKASAEGSEIGLVMIVLHRDGNEILTQIAGTVPPEVVEYAIKSAAESWGMDQPGFVMFKRERKKIV